MLGSRGATPLCSPTCQARQDANHWVPVGGGVGWGKLKVCLMIGSCRRPRVDHLTSVSHSTLPGARLVFSKTTMMVLLNVTSLSKECPPSPTEAQALVRSWVRETAWAHPGPWGEPWEMWQSPGPQGDQKIRSTSSCFRTIQGAGREVLRTYIWLAW